MEPKRHQCVDLRESGQAEAMIRLVRNFVAIFRVAAMNDISRKPSLSSAQGMPCSCLTISHRRELKDKSRFFYDVAGVESERKEIVCRQKLVKEQMEAKVMMKEEKNLKGCPVDRVRKWMVKREGDCKN